MENLQKTLTILQSSINTDLDINIVTCPQCGRLNSHPLHEDLEKLTCKHCNLHDDLSNFPDLLY